MNSSQQLELNLQTSLLYPYQVLEQTFEVEEALSKQPTKKNTADSQKMAVGMTIQNLVALSPQVSGNPYSRISQEDDEFGRSAEADVKVSAAAYIKFTTRVLKQYSPSVGKRRTLRAEFRKFIDEPHTRSPENRIRIVGFLRQYDLESAGFAPPLFNRELSDDLLGKLRKITGK